MTIAALRLLLDEVQPDVVRPPAPQLPPRRIHPRSKENRHVNAYDAVILSMNSDNYSDQQIADHLGIDRAEVTQIIDVAKADQSGRPQVPAERIEQQAPAPEAIPGVAELLAWAAAHDDKAVRADGERAAAVLGALRERRQVDAELEQITTEATQLEKRLTELRTRECELRPAAKPGKQRDYDPREVRAWAREQQLAVPDRGQIPKDVLAAWRQRPDHRPLAVAS
ncbi:histone-like nucleoid-structuring protein Lsr2 [Streptomyces sp. NPDC060366]|uniref:Lsr2 family DNA-binding protein n=1 Tax=Streptomyces sp. NPDC060366 TaxID=3347105 RepID=UPI003647379D